VSLPRNVLCYGSESSLPTRTPLRAGPLSLFFEAGDLRYIRLGEREVLRRVYVALRDRSWHTLPLELSNLQEEISLDSFRITFDAENKQGEIDFSWKGAIRGDANGTITFAMDGEARSTFLRNRLGLCVLHPIRGCAGEACRVEKVDGSVEASGFPRYISPHQPFLNVRAISHQIAPGLWAEVRFTGDVFETEDQRNWTDASYKTYSTPLEIPYPVEVKQGTRISQSVTLTLKGSAPAVEVSSSGTAVRLSLSHRPTGPLPSLGVGCGYEQNFLTEREIARLKCLNLSHLRIDFRPGLPDFDEQFKKAVECATQIAVPLEIAVMLGEAAEQELDRLKGLVAQFKPKVARWLIFHVSESSTTPKWVTLARARLSVLDANAKIGGGSNRYFAELNRARPSLDAVDFACYPLNPQVHASDRSTLVENLEGQAFVADTAHQFLGRLPIVVSPVTLKPRVPWSAASGDISGCLPRDVDPRQMSLLGAGWTAISIKYLAEAGVESVTYYELTGWRGVMERSDQGLPRSDQFRSIIGSVFPLYHVLGDVGEFAGASVVPVITSDRFRVDGLAIQKDGKTRMLVANLGPDTETIQIENLPARGACQVKHLDETNAESAMTSPEQFRREPGTTLRPSGPELELKLRPYAVARIDSSE
jgi:hypothetical protein